MTNDFYTIPAVLRWPTLLLTFAGSLILFHWLLILVWPLSKRGWEILDYVWLVAGFVALAGAVFTARQWFPSGNGGR